MVVVVGEAVDDRHGGVATSSAQGLVKGGAPMMASTSRLTTRAVSATVWWPPRWISPGRRYCACPRARSWRPEADARARGRMFEDHRQRATLEERRQRAGAVAGFEGNSQVEHAQQLLAGVVLVGEEVAAARAGEAG